MFIHLFQLNGSISAAAFNFIVQDPNGIIECVNERSFFSKVLMYLINSDSEWYLLKTLLVKNSVFLIKPLGIFVLSLNFKILSESVFIAVEKIETIVFKSSIEVVSLILIETVFLSG
jgi:hypothetical protein